MSATVLAPAPSTIYDLCTMEDMAQRMLAIMQREELSESDVRLLLGHGSANVLSNVLALAKNPRLSREGLLIVWQEMTAWPSGHRSYLSTRYIFSHPAMTRADARRLINAIPMDDLTWRDVDDLAQLMTCPHLSTREWKGLVKKILQVYRSEAFEQGTARMLSGIHNTVDPTALMAEEPALSSEQLAHLYDRVEPGTRINMSAVSRGSIRRSIMKHPNAPREIRNRMVQTGPSADHYSLAGLAANPTVSQEEMEVLRVALSENKNFLALGAPVLASNPRTTFLEDVYAQTLVERGMDNYFYLTDDWVETTVLRLLRNAATSSDLFNQILGTTPIKTLSAVFLKMKHDPFADPRTDSETRTLLLNRYAEAGLIPRSSWLKMMGISEASALDLFDAASGQSRVTRVKKTKSLELLSHAARNEDFDVRQQVASHELTSAEDLALLARDEDSKVRHAAGWNQNTPESSLLVLATDPAHEVKMSLAQRKNLPEAVQHILAVDKNWQVRKYLWKNQSVLEDIREQLSRDRRLKEEKGNY